MHNMTFRNDIMYVVILSLLFSCLALFGRPERCHSEISNVPSPYEKDPNYSFKFDYPQFSALFVPLKSWDKTFYNFNYLRPDSERALALSEDNSGMVVGLNQDYIIPFRFELVNYT